jgi:HEXXH motif-containing protein
VEVFRLLSTPREGDFAALATELAAAQHHAFVVRAMRVAKLAGAPDDPVLGELARRIAERPPSLASWTPEVGVLATGLEATDEAGHRWLQAQAALAGMVTGVITHLALETTVDRPLLVCGRRVAPGPVQLRGDVDALEIVGRDEVQRFHRQAGVWFAEGAEAAIVPTRAGPLRLVGSGWHSLCDEPHRAVAPDAQIIDQLAGALELLGEAAPEYLDWVLCLLKEVTPIGRPDERTLASGSSVLRPGGIDVAVPASAIETAEMLIHECSHQYLHMLSWFGAVVTKDARPHYSPLKKCERPLERIVLGYHAFGNVMLAYAQLRAHGHAEGIASRHRVVSGYVAELVKPLVDEVGLSELGREIVRPLRARLGGEAMTSEPPRRDRAAPNQDQP